MMEGEDRQWLNVVIVDDDESHIALATRSIERAFRGHPRRVRVLGYNDPERALAEVPESGETVILLDYRLRESTGLEWLGDFIREDVGPIIILTSSGDETIAAEAFRLGASDYLVKDLFIEASDAIASSINGALRRFRIERSNRDLRRRLKTANRELARRNERLGELTETAHRFVEDVAHEFRTPLAVIKEFASIISDGLGGPVTGEQQDYLGFIGHATRDLADLVDDFLDSGKLQARTLRVTRRDHDLEKLIVEAMPMLESRARARDIPLRLDISDAVGQVHVDAEKIRRILVNLVVNAIKFSTAGEPVTIHADLLPSTDHGLPEEVRIGVRDEGPGLPPEEVEHLFERFRQGAEAGRIATRGFGLGLSIVQGLVDVNLGTMGVESELGQGSTFWFTVPRGHPVDLVAAYLRNAARRSPDGLVTLYRIARPGDQRPTAARELAAFLADFSHAGDLQLPGGEPLTASGSCVHMLVETDEPAAWRGRIVEADALAREEGRQPGQSPIVIQERGSWMTGDAAGPVLEALAQASALDPILRTEFPTHG